MTHVAHVDERGRVSDELVCVGCGYLLRGQTIGERCPECGGTVQLTLDAQHLVTWPPDWIRRLRFGLWLLAGAVAVGWVGMAAFSVTSLLLTGGVAFSLLRRYAKRLGAVLEDSVSPRQA